MRKIREFDAEKMWQAAADFHGHECPGLAIGFRAAEYAHRDLALENFSDDDLLVVASRQFCGLDAFQVIMGSTLGKKNLLIREEEAMSFTVYNKANSESIRIVARAGVLGGGPSQDLAAKEQKRLEILAARLEDILETEIVKIPLADL